MAPEWARKPGPRKAHSRFAWRVFDVPTAAVCRRIAGAFGTTRWSEKRRSTSPLPLGRGGSAATVRGLLPIAVAVASPLTPALSPMGDGEQTRRQRVAPCVSDRGGARRMARAAHRAVTGGDGRARHRFLTAALRTRYGARERHRYSGLQRRVARRRVRSFHFSGHARTDHIPFGPAARAARKRRPRLERCPRRRTLRRQIPDDVPSAQGRHRDAAHACLRNRSPCPRLHGRSRTHAGYETLVRQPG